MGYGGEGGTREAGQRCRALRLLQRIDGGTHPLERLSRHWRGVGSLLASLERIDEAIEADALVDWLVQVVDEQPDTTNEL